MAGCQQILLSASRFTAKLAALRNLAILLRKTDESEEVVRFLMNQQVFAAVSSILASQEDDLVHITLDSVLHILKVDDSL